MDLEQFSVVIGGHRNHYRSARRRNVYYCIVMRVSIPRMLVTRNPPQFSSGRRNTPAPLAWVQD